MKTKKLISLFCAAAMTVSSFAGLTITASAAVGDVLINQNFDDADNTTPWGTPVEQSTIAEDGTVTWNKVIGTAYVDSATLGTVPASVTGNVFNFSSDGGNNSPTGTVTIDAATGTAQAYNVSFDAYIKNAKKDSYGDLNGADSPEEAYEYIFGFGDGTNDVIRFDVKGQDIYFVSNGVNIDTGIKTGAEGVWVKADVKCDVASKSVKGTITPEGGEAANLDASFSASGASSISKLYAASIRFSGNTKGYINNYIDNFVVTEAAPIVPCNITINQKCGETVLATETVKGGIGESYTVGASYKVPFATEQSREAGKYYKYDETSIDTIVAAEGSVIDLNFVETDMPTVTVKATTGDSMTPVASMAEVRGVPGEKPTIYISEYVKSTDDKWYQKDDKNTGGRGDMYNVSVEITADDSDKLIPYKPAFNVVSFLEAEDSENVVESDDGLAGGTYNTDYIRDYASGGVWAQSTTGTTYPTGFYTAPVAEAGTYEITVRTHDMKRTAAIAKVAADDTMTKIGQTTYDSGIAFTTVKADLEAGEKIWVGKNGEIGTDDASASTKLINDVDYIVVKDANKKADTDPVVTFNYANKVASLTSDKDRTVKAVVIHAQYGGGILTDVKQHPVDILSGAVPTTVNIEEPVYEGDKFMVWETLDGLKPLLVPAYTVPQGSGDAKPKFTVTVAEGIANGTVTPDKAQAEQGETVTLTVTPAQGYVLDTLTVKDADNADITVTNNTFTMPAKNVTVTATFKAQIAGTVTIAGTAKVGETITATVAELPAGATAKYQWQLATAQDGEFTDVQGANEASKKLSSVSQDKYVRVVVTADGFDGQLVSNVLGPVGEAAAPITKYAITKVVDPADTATVTTTIGDGTAVDEVTDGINVTVNATATGDNAVKEIVVTETEGGASVAFNAETKTFKMPAKAVTVTVKTAPLFAITKAAAENGSFTVSADKAAEGTAITVTPTANEGYKVDTVKFNDTVIEAEDGAYSFTMPAMAVTVTVTFASTDKAVYLIGTKGNPVSFAEGNQGNWTAGGSTLTATVDSASDKPSVNLKNNANGGSCYYYSTFAETSDIMDLSFEVKPTSGSLALNINKDGWNTWTNHTNIAIINEDSINYGSEKIADLTKGEWNTVKISMDLQLGTITFTVGETASVTKPMLAFDSKSYQSNDGGVKPVSVTMLRFVHNNKSASDMNFTNFLLKATPRETELPKKTLTVSKNIDGGKAYIGAEGTVTSEVTQSTNVIATAEGTETVRFNAWKDAGGNVLATTPTITRRMYADETITADFTQLYTAELTYTLDGAGVEGIEVSVGETKKTTDANGKVTFIFEPGTYTATTIAGDYKATSKEITIGTANVTDTVTLESNAQTLAAIDIDSSMMNTGILTTTADSKVVGKLSTKQYANVEKTEEMVTPANIEWSASNAGIAVAADGTVTITNVVTAGDYTITATAGGVTATYDLTVAATGTEKVKAASEDFEGTTNIFGAPLVTDYDTFGYREVSGFTNVFLMGKEAEKTVTFSPVMFANADTTVFKTDVYYGWDNATSGSTVALLDDQDNVVASWTINNNVSAAAGTPQISAIIGGTAATGNIDTLNMWSGSNGVNNSNGWSNRPYKAGEHGTVTVTVATNGDVTIDFNNNNHNDKFVRTGQVTGTTTSTNISKIKINSTHKSADRMISLDNLLTTQVKSE